MCWYICFRPLTLTLFAYVKRSNRRTHRKYSKHDYYHHTHARTRKHTPFLVSFKCSTTTDFILFKHPNDNLNAVCNEIQNVNVYSQLQARLMKQYIVCLPDPLSEIVLTTATEACKARNTTVNNTKHWRFLVKTPNRSLRAETTTVLVHVLYSAFTILGHKENIQNGASSPSCGGVMLIWKGLLSHKNHHTSRDF